MKKLSLLIALCMLLSIGGVYANWVYMEGVAGTAHDHVGSFGLSSASNSGSKGQLTISGVNAHMTINPRGNTYFAQLDFSGTFEITFIPTEAWASANKDVHEFTVQWKLETTNANPTDYEVTCDAGKAKLFTKFDTSTVATVKLTRQSNGNFVGQLDASALASLITLGEFSLDDYATYGLCSTDIGQFGNIGITVSEG